ncbi:peptidylprolyl isomerase [Gemelliphila palaticanis]|uniref:peptidylprolyl isomerase n=1 Tax=Gemelliphila palaticanis TaxID=81950 RepID=A0ABX2T2N8_9BACL|nr:peptidylprolyl isomerase [Gemella palaticanis]MBF0715794.1 peptidylprolyl isomerase [Gemella palaticanis]NYS47724.1 peptidylprolyl isomerase [Gemella palaticanis]
MKKIKKITLPILLSTSVLTLAGCSSINSGEKYISSKAGDVTQSEVLEYIGNQNISKAATDVAIRKVLLDKYKDKISDDLINKKFEEAQNQYGGKEQFEELLKKEGFSSDKYKEGLKVRLAQAYMINDYNNVTEDKIKETYEKEKKQYNIAHILISVKGETSPNGLSDEDAKKKAEEVLAKIKDGGDFSELAKENSTDTANSSKGGELGWSSKDNSPFVKEFAEAAYSLDKGQVSENVVKTPFGYHIIKILDTRELSFEDLKYSIIEELANKAISSDPTISSKALQKIFDEYGVNGNTSEVKSYINEMLAGTKNS